MSERKGIVTVGGKPITLVGNEVKVGDKAPEFALVGNDMKPVHLKDFAGKTVVLSAVGSLDTATCDIETRRFNDEASKLGSDTVILTVSMDLPFAQKRWCGAAGVERVITASDHREASFGNAYGVLVKESRLLARAIFLVGKDGVVKYIQIVPEIAKEPNYDEVLAELKKLSK